VTLKYSFVAINPGAATTYPNPSFLGEGAEGFFLLYHSDIPGLPVGFPCLRAAVQEPKAREPASGSCIPQWIKSGKPYLTGSPRACNYL
jgi:hypothetical protein